MKKTIFTLILLVLVFTGCASMGVKQSSWCDNMKPGESVMCDVAKKYDLHLETAGNIIMVANLASIDLELYDKASALKVLKSLKSSLNINISGSGLVSIVMDKFKQYPSIAIGGALVISQTIGYLDVPQILTKKDKEALNWWIDEQIKILE